MHATARGAGLLLLGCSDRGSAARAGGPHDCAEGPPGERVGEAPFVGEDIPPLDTLVGEGLDARLYFDHSELTADALIVPSEHFYVRTAYPDQLVPPDPWIIRVRGLVDQEIDLQLPQLAELEADQGVHLLECSGNRGSGFGLIGAARWGGIPMADVLDRIRPRAGAARVLVSGFDNHSMPSKNQFSTPGASWIFGLEQLVDQGAFLATTLDGKPLPKHHGKPARLFVPGWYGCTAIKWVNEIRLVGDDEPATSQMIEFATRTHQPSPTPSLARDFRPATMDQSAMPVRVERWKAPNGSLSYRIVGVMWGGYEVTDALEVRFGDGPWERVDFCTAPSQEQTWSLWSHVVRPSSPGVYSIRMRVADPDVPQLRLSADWYLRQVRIDAV